jgi:hypothetical protein
MEEHNKSRRFLKDIPIGLSRRSLDIKLYPLYNMMGSPGGRARTYPRVEGFFQLFSNYFQKSFFIL